MQLFGCILHFYHQTIIIRNSWNVNQNVEYHGNKLIITLLAQAGSYRVYYAYLKQPVVEHSLIFLILKQILAWKPLLQHLKFSILQRPIQKLFDHQINIGRNLKLLWHRCVLYLLENKLSLLGQQGLSLLFSEAYSPFLSFSNIVNIFELAREHKMATCSRIFNILHF